VLAGSGQSKASPLPQEYSIDTNLFGDVIFGDSIRLINHVGVWPSNVEPLWEGRIPEVFVEIGSYYKPEYLRLDMASRKYQATERNWRQYQGHKRKKNKKKVK